MPQAVNPRVGRIKTLDLEHRRARFRSGAHPRHAAVARHDESAVRNTEYRVRICGIDCGRVAIAIRAADPVAGGVDGAQSRDAGILHAAERYADHPRRVPFSACMASRPGAICIGA